MHADLRTSSVFWRAQQGNHVTPIAAINAEVRFIHGQNQMMPVKLTHTDKAEVGKVGLPVSVASRQLSQPPADYRKDEITLQQTLHDKFHNVNTQPEMDSSSSHDG